MSKESKLIKNTVIIAVGNICTKCISFFMLPLYTSILTTEEYGTLDIISTYVMLFTIVLTLQFEQALFRYLIESRDNKEQQKKYIATSMWTIVLINIIFLMIFIPVLRYNRYQYMWELIVWTILSCFHAVLLQIPRGFGNNLIYTVGSFINGSLNVILNVFFIAIFRLGIVGMLYANIVSLIVSIIYLFFYFRIWRYIKLKNFDKNYLKILIYYAFPLIPYTLCWWIISASDRWIINIFLGSSANGIYSIAYKFPAIFAIVIGIFQTAWTESAAENIESEDREKYYQSIIDKSIRFYSSGSMMIIGVIPFIFLFLIKNDFTDAYNYIPILMLSSLLHGVSSMYGSIYFAYKKTKEVAWTAAISAILNVLINLIFIRKIGLYAAVFSTFIAYIVAILIRQKDIQKLTPISLNRKYLIIEAVMYIIVFIGYYSKIKVVQIILLIVLFPYSIYQNKEIILAIVYKFLKKRR